MLVLVPQLRAEELGGFSFMPDWLNIARQIAVPMWTFGVWVGAMPVVHGLGRLRTAVAVAVGLVPATLVALAVIR